MSYECDTPRAQTDHTDDRNARFSLQPVVGGYIPGALPNANLLQTTNAIVAFVFANPCKNRRLLRRGPQSQSRHLSPDTGRPPPPDVDLDLMARRASSLEAGYGTMSNLVVIPYLASS